MVFVALQPDRFSKVFQSPLLQTAVPEQKAALSVTGTGISMGCLKELMSSKWQDVKPQPWGRCVPARQVQDLVIRRFGLGFNFTEL